MSLNESMFGFPKSGLSSGGFEGLLVVVGVVNTFEKMEGEVTCWPPNNVAVVVTEEDLSPKILLGDTTPPNIEGTVVGVEGLKMFPDEVKPPNMEGVDVVVVESLEMLPPKMLPNCGVD